MIPYGHQLVDDDDVAAVVAVLKGDRLTQGPAVEAFEQALCERTTAAHAVAFANGTAALHAAAAVAGLGPGDVVATSPLSFAASAACATYVGATPTYLDIDPATLNLPPEAVPEGLDGLVAVHFAGLPVDLTRLAHRPPVVIEDAAHAIGATTPDGPVGACAHSDLCCFSFHPVKTITTGEGGAVTTNDAEMASELRRFRHHGIVPGDADEPWRAQIPRPGFNYRLTDLQAALGTSQLAKLDRFLARREELAQRYRALLADLPVALPPEAPSGFDHGRHLFPVQVADRARVHAELHAAGIGVQVHYVPIYRHPAYAGPDDRPERFPATEAAYTRLLSLPLFPGLRDDEQDQVVAALRSAVERP